MPRIKIEDLPQDMKITKEEMKKVMGGPSVKNVGFQEYYGVQDLAGNIFIEEGDLFNPIQK